MAIDVTEVVYLGDGLYAEFDGWQVGLFASNGERRLAAVYLEPDVLATFLNYVSELKKAMAEKRACVSAEPPTIVVSKVEEDGGD